MSPLEPLRTDDRAAVGIGIGLWVAALVVAVLARDWLQQTGRGWWAEVCMAGIVLGLAGLAFVHRRERRGR